MNAGGVAFGATNASGGADSYVTSRRRTGGDMRTGVTCESAPLTYHSRWIEARRIPTRIEHRQIREGPRHHRTPLPAR
jgi:hypothetical protein